MITLQTQLDTIQERIANAQDIVARRERSVNRAERNLEIAEDNLAELQNERDKLLIASWGDKPNWQVIFDLVDPSQAMYEYKEKWIRKKGLHAAGMYNCDTNQGAFAVGFSTTSEYELNKNVRMVEFVMQYLRADRNNDKTMIVYNVPTDDCCFNFVFNTVTRKYAVTTDSYMCRRSIIEHSTLEQALRYLQSISDTDIVSEPENLPDSLKSGEE